MNLTPDEHAVLRVFSKTLVDGRASEALTVRDISERGPLPVAVVREVINSWRDRGWAFCAGFHPDDGSPCILFGEALALASAMAVEASDP